MKISIFFKRFFIIVLSAAIWSGIAHAGVSGKPDIEVVSLTDSPDPVEANGEITYTVNIKNSSSDVSAFNVYVDFSSGSSLSLTQISGSGWSCSGNHCTYAMALPPGMSASTLQLKRIAPGSAGTVDLTAHADSDSTDGDTSNNIKTVYTTVEAPKEPYLKITKTANKTNMNVGDTVTFTLKAENTGNATATGTKVTDTVPDIFDITSLSSSDCSEGSNQAVTCNIGNLNAGGSKTYTITAKAVESGDATNTGKISADNASSKTSSVSLHVKGAKLVAKTISAYNVASGETTSFAYRIKNEGDAVANNTYLTVDLDDSFKNIHINGPSSGCSILSGNKIKCGPYNLNSGDYSPTISIEGQAPKVSSNRSYKTVFEAETSSAGSSTHISSTRWKTVYAVNLNISKSASPSEVGPNDDVTFTLNIKNVTGAKVSGVSVDDPLPSGFSVESIDPSSYCGYSSSGGTDTVHCDFPPLSNNERKTVSISAKASSSLGTYNNTATTTSTYATRSWSDDATVKVSGPQLNVDKRVSPSYVAPGGDVVYTIDVTNDGFATAYDVVVDDSAFPSGFTVTKIEPAGCSLSSCNLGDIAKNQTKTMKIYAHTGSATGNFTNTAKAEDNVGNKDEDSATVHVQNVDIQAILSCTDYTAISGSYICDAYIRERNRPAVTDAHLTFKLPTDPNRVSFRNPALSNIDSRFDCSVSGRNVECQMKSGKQIGQGSTRIVRVNLKAFDETQFDESDFYHNGILHTLDVSTTLADGNSGNNHDDETTYVRGANPSITKTGPAESGPGHDITYTLHVQNWPRENAVATNIPNTPAQNISVTDTLPSEVEFVKAEGTNWNCPSSVSGNIVTCNYTKTVYVNHSATDLKITAKIKNSTSLDTVIENHAFVETSTKELTAIRGDNNTSFSTTVKGAHLSTSITSSLDSVVEGNKVVFDFEVDNDGYAPAEEVSARFSFDRPELVDSIQLINAPSYCQAVGKYIECNTTSLTDGDSILGTVEVITAGVNGDQVLTTYIAADANNTDSSSAQKSITIVDFATYAEWRMDDCHLNSGIVKEENGNFPGTIENTVKKILYGKLCTALKIPKNNAGKNRIKTAVDLNDLNGDATIMFWYKSFSNWKDAKKQRLFDSTTTHKNKYFYLQLDGGRLYFKFESSDDDDFNYYTKDKLNFKKYSWHHIALTYDTSNHTIQLFIDGSPVELGKNKTWLKNIADVGPLYIGGNSSSYAKGRSANGAFDEFKIFDPVLDTATINSIYKNEKKGKNFNGSDRACPECGVDAIIQTFTTNPNKLYADNEFSYIIKVRNIEIYPIEEINLTVDIDDRAELLDINHTSDWSCSYDDHSSQLHCYFDADGNSSALFKQYRTDIITLQMQAPNAVVKKPDLLTSTAVITTGPQDDFPDNNTKTLKKYVSPVDISISKTADNDEPDQNQPYLYTLHISNNSGIAKNITVVDEIESTLNITSIANNDANWTCSTIGHTIQCNRDTMPAIYDGDIYIMVTPTVDKTIHNEANVTTTTAETKLKNNTAAVDVNVQSSVGSGWDKSKFKDFTLRKNRTFYGDLLVIGNSNLVGNAQNGDKLSDINTSYVSGGVSYAELMLESYKKVKFARLYWTGHLHGEAGDSSDEGTDESFKTVTFYTPDGHQHTLTADDNDSFYYYYKDGGDTFRRIYSASVDVTDILNEVNATLGGYGGTYGVGDIKANTGKDIFIRTPILDSNGNIKPDNIKFGHFAGWNLVVFYEVDHREHRELVYKNINIFDGFRKLVPASVGYEKLTIPVSGFITPKFGDIDSRLSLFAAGGEKAVELDSISMVSMENNTSAEVKISDALNPEDNVLNGTISRNGSDVATRVPDQSYNIGIDLDQFDISSDFNINKVYFGHLQQETNITLSVGREKSGSYEIFDQSFPTAIGISTQIYNPDFIDSYKECFVEDPLTGTYKSCSDVNVSRGGEIIYRITIVNTGDEKASNVIIEDPLPKEVDFNISTAELKVVTDSKPLCAGLDTSAESINDCVQHLETLGVFDHKVLTEEGKEYIRDFFNSDINQTNNQLYENVWDTSFHDYNVTSFTDDDGNDRTKLTIDLSNELNRGEGDEYEGYFPALNVTWIEFKVKVNVKAILNKTFENVAYINFTNPTLAAYGYPDATQRQESASVESPPVVFQWTSLQGDIRDPGRVSVGTKIVNHPFDLNVSIDDSNSSFASFAANYPDVNLTVAAIALVDINQIPSGGTCKNYMSTTTLASFNRPYYGNDGVPDFGILSNEYVPIGSGMYWLTDSNISTAIAARKIGFCLLFRMSYKDGSELKFADAPAFYGPFGDHFASRPERIDFDTGLPKTGEYYVVTSGQTFALDANATDGLTPMGTPGYTTLLSATDIGDGNTSMNTLSIYDEKGCIDYRLTDPAAMKVHFFDFNFTDGEMAAIPNNKFDDVGIVTVRVRDANWTEVDITNGDCNNTDDDDQNGSFVSCAVKGEAKFIFIPAQIEVQTTVNNQGNGFTYMANDLDAMHTTIHTTVRSLNLDGNVTEAFKSGCYADDVNLTLDANITFSSAETQPYTINWKVDGESTINTLSLATGGMANIAYTIGESNFTDGEANLDFLVNVARTTNHAHYPLDMDTLTGKTLIDNYLGYVDVPESTSTLDADNVARFWYARLHAPDYRSSTTTVETPIYIEVFCNNDRADCSQWGINGLPESSDDVDWWVNSNHTGAHLGLLFDMNATQKGVLDPLIKINSTGNVVNDLNQSFSGGVYVPTVTYTGSSNLYRTKINTAPSSWLKYNRFFPDGRTFYHVEFNLQSDDWSGIGERGETVETNGSRKSNRRLEW